MKRNKLLPFLLLSGMLFLSSCATIINSSHKKVQFVSEEKNLPFVVNDDPTIYYTDTTLNIKRSKESLILQIDPEENGPKFEVEPRLSNSYVLGNLIFPPYFLGYSLDLLSEKMYSYPGKIALEKDIIYLYPQIRGTSSQVKGIHPGVRKKPKIKILEEEIKSGAVNLNLTILSLQIFNWDTPWGRDVDNWAFAAGIGLEYFLKPDLYLSGGIEGMWHSSGSIIESPSWESSERNISKALQTKFQLGKAITKSAWLVAGIQMSHTYYSTTEHKYSFYPEHLYPDDLKVKSHYLQAKNNYGLALGLKFKKGSSFFSFDYSPSFISHQFDGWKGEYNHTIGISFGSSIKLKN